MFGPYPLLAFNMNGQASKKFLERPTRLKDHVCMFLEYLWHQLTMFKVLHKILDMSHEWEICPTIVMMEENFLKFSHEFLQLHPPPCQNQTDNPHLLDIIKCMGFMKLCRASSPFPIIVALLLVWSISISYKCFSLLLNSPTYLVVVVTVESKLYVPTPN